MVFILKSAGVFVYPLALCSFLVLWVFLSRLWVLRPSKILPSAFREGKGGGPRGATSLAGRLVKFSKCCCFNPRSIKTFIAAEMTALERGLFLIDGVVGVAPLLGLLGTVAGLMNTFVQLDISSTGGEMDYFSRGISLALSTTFLGLATAIPALLASVYLRRRLDIIEANLNLLAERVAHASEGARAVSGPPSP